MAGKDREKIIQYIRSLEKKVKNYQQSLKERDKEIVNLRSKLSELIEEPYSNEEYQQEQESEKTSLSQSNKSFTPKKQVQPLEEKPRTFVKKAKAGTDQRVKEAMASKEDQYQDAEDEQDFQSPQDQPETASTEQETEQQPTPPKPSMNFKPGKFLSAVLDGEEEADEVKSLLEQLDICDKDERRPIFQSLTKLHWNMIAKMGKRLAYENLPWEKRLFMRYGMLDEKLMEDRMDVWEQLYFDKSKPDDTCIYFIDEWFEEIARGTYKYSTIDEMALDGAKPDPNARGETALKYEVLSVPQMQRMCVGPRANTITILTQEYCQVGRDNPVVNRSWLPQALNQCIKCDHLMFYRKYKGDEFYVQPIFIVCPGYGQRSGCWEPWSPGQKGKSGPRICICAFPPRNSMKTLLQGLADYRWEYAKADAMHYWLSEGLTGKWLGLFSVKEQRKDLKGFFVDSYYHWVVHESRRIPKLDKKHREFFWHNIPFSDEIKQNLKGGGVFGRLIELEEAKKKREEEERQEIERIKAEREARRAARKSKLEGGS